MSAAPASILVLAGRRAGVVDPFAAAHGVEDKCLVPVAGRPLIGHVLSAALEAAGSPHVVISTNDPEVLAGVREVAALKEAGRLTLCPSRGNLADSVLAAAADAAFPMLITTADNALFSAASMAELAAAAGQAAADAAVAFARREDVLAAHPDGQRKFSRFTDAEVSNCNAYWLGDRRALRLAETFRSGGQFVKHPLRILRVFGLVNLIRFRFGIGRLDRTFQRFSRRFGLTVQPVLLSDGAAAIDVDHDRSLGVTEAVLKERETASAELQRHAAAA